MLSINSLVVVLLLAAAALNVVEAASCPAGYSEYNGQCYKLYTTPLVVWEAEAVCRNDGAGNLASVHNRDEHIYLREMAYATDTSSMGKFIIGYWYWDNYNRWIDRTPSDYLPFTINNKRKQCQAVWGKTKHDRSPIRFSRFRCRNSFPYFCKVTAGACTGRVVKADPANQVGSTAWKSDLSACDSHCQGTGSCTYFTYNVVNKDCKLYSGSFASAPSVGNRVTLSGEAGCSANMNIAEKELCYYHDAGHYWKYDSCTTSSLGASCGLTRVHPVLHCAYCGEIIDDSNCPSPAPTYTVCSNTDNDLPNFGERAELQINCNGPCSVDYSYLTVSTSDDSQLGIHESQPASDGLCGTSGSCLYSAPTWAEGDELTGSVTSTQNELYVTIDDKLIDGVNNDTEIETWSMTDYPRGNYYSVTCYEGAYGTAPP